jgi:Sjogren's syndrome/scleroderma autoantigen 1 (Autoantigen p27)
MSSESSSNLKNAASLLIKGGTLTGEPCEKCGGVMIRFGEKSTCINCSAEKIKPGTQQERGESPKQPSSLPSDLGVCVGIIEQKIVGLASDLAVENDIMLQKQKADLMESYLRILEKVKSLTV